MDKKKTAKIKKTKDKKIKIAWFTFSCSEDNTMIMLEIMNDHWQEWKKLFDFRNVHVLKEHNKFDEFDIAFIEGAIASEEHIEKLKKIRKITKKLVAVGACAIMGLPAGQRNSFAENQKNGVEFLLKHFASLPKVLKVSQVVKVDAEIPGCPIDPNSFLKVVNGLVA